MALLLFGRGPQGRFLRKMRERFRVFKDELRQIKNLIGSDAVIKLKEERKHEDFQIKV